MNGKIDFKGILMACGILVGVGVLVGQFYYIRDRSVSRAELKVVVAEQNLVLERRLNRFEKSVDTKLDKILRQTR
ncbi:hypothetical protein LCGC14_2338750 [marine sediment metagenome]|uniref:Uncharacterized protein n=1 Tax=marine sediment metagenome TaxID=412755 RepID=A0A0F9CDG0_9ZZZZ